jgi:hypothetical protein
MPDLAIETQQTELTALEQIDNLLVEPATQDAGESRPEGDAAEESQQAAEGATDASAESEIDYTLEIPMPSGEKVALGKLKDLWQQQAEATLELQEKENAILQQKGQLEKLAEWVNAVPADIRQAAIITAQNQLVVEHTNLVKAIPAWADRTAYEAGRARIFDLAKEYGIQDAVADIVDHRAVKLLHDFAALKDAVKAARLNLKPVDKARPKPHLVSKGGKPTEAQVLADRAKATKRPADQLAAIEKLLI